MDFIPMIEKLAREKTCIVGMGNYYKKDDEAGLFVIDELKGRVDSDTITLMNVEDVLENYVYKIAGLECDNVLIIDAVESASEAGTVLFGRLHDFNEEINAFSTHKLTLAISGKILEEHNKKVWLLGIEALDTDFGRGMTDRVEESACFIRDILYQHITSGQKELVYEQ
jgi:hydrogenase maturation protease